MPPVQARGVADLSAAGARDDGAVAVGARDDGAVAAGAAGE